MLFLLDCSSSVPAPSVAATVAAGTGHGVLYSTVDKYLIWRTTVVASTRNCPKWWIFLTCTTDTRELKTTHGHLMSLQQHLYNGLGGRVPVGTGMDSLVRPLWLAYGQHCGLRMSQCWHGMDNRTDRQRDGQSDNIMLSLQPKNVPS